MAAMLSSCCIFSYEPKAPMSDGPKLLSSTTEISRCVPVVGKCIEVFAVSLSLAFIDDDDDDDDDDDEQMNMH